MEQRPDAEMMESDTATAPSIQQEIAANRNGGQGNNVWGLLALARQLLNQGKPSQALQAVVMAMRTRGGDEAVFRSLHRARELYKTRLQENAAVDQLASLFAECVIAEAQPLETGQPQDDAGDQWVVRDAHGTSILAETGRMQVVLDAFSDGSSFICLKCGGLVVGVEAPVPISTKLGDFNNVFHKIISAGERPHFSVPETEAGKIRRLHHWLINLSLISCFGWSCGKGWIGSLQLNDDVK